MGKYCEYPKCKKRARRDTVLLLKRQSSGKFHQIVTHDCVRHSERRLGKVWTGVSQDKKTGEVMASTEPHVRKLGEERIEMPVRAGIQIVQRVTIA